MSGSSGAFHLILLKIEPKFKSDWSRFVAAIESLAHTDPNFFSTVDAENGEAHIGGVSETQLDVIMKELIRLGVLISIGAPHVAYRETISRKLSKDYTHKKLSHGKGQFARVILEVEPNERGAGNMFASKAAGDSVPEEFLPGVKKGLDTVLTNGPLSGFPVVDMKVTLIDGAFHEVDSSPIAFEIATRQAVRDAIEHAGSVLLEPIMYVDVNLLEDFMGSVIDDLNSRGGQISGVSVRGNANIINALVPLANMFGYGPRLSSISNGSATFTMNYSHYQAVVLPGPDNFPSDIGMRA